MALDIKQILYNLPEVKKPVEKKLGFNVKLKWTIIILAAFFILGNITLFGLAEDNLPQLQFLQTVLASQFGTILTLGVGPIVTASIILQLLVGSGILSIDTKTEEGKRYFQGLQKIGTIFFIIFEALIFVLMGGLRAAPGFTSLLVFQIILGGFAVMFMDEVSQKWGFGSGVSLFILAGVAATLFTGLFQFVTVQGGIVTNCITDFGSTPCSGNVLIVIQSIINGDTTRALVATSAIIATVLIFLAVVWAQSLKVEIPLAYDRLRGYGMKWPLSFFYASVIPVILVAALAANVQLGASLVERVATPCIDGIDTTECSGGAKFASYFTFLGRTSQGIPISGLAFWIGSSNIVESLITGSFRSLFLLQAVIHLLFYMTLSAVFAVFWVKTSGMDESSQAKNILGSGLQLPGFRKDPRVLESILKRYIMPLTIMGGLAIGALASVANLLGAITGGTSILLAVMIAYNFYQNIAQQHALDMHPSMKKFFA